MGGRIAMESVAGMVWNTQIRMIINASPHIACFPDATSSAVPSIRFAISFTFRTTNLAPMPTFMAHKLPMASSDPLISIFPADFHCQL
jgi:hypothetical protein